MWHFNLDDRHIYSTWLYPSLLSNYSNRRDVVGPMRFIANAAGGLLPVLAEALQSTFQATILTSYGMTEW